MANVAGFDALQASKATDPTKVDFSGVTASGDVLKIALISTGLRVPPEDGAAGLQPGAARGRRGHATPSSTTTRSVTGRS